MSVRIIVESSADMSEDIKSRVTVIPLVVRFGEEEFLDGVNLTHEQFYEKLAACNELPKTSQATPVDFAEAFEEVVAAGDTAVVLTISSTLSGTYQNAVVSAEDFEGRIFVVDSRTAAIGTGVLAEYALRLVDEGVSAEQIAQKLEQKRSDVCIIAMLDTLEYLKKGGRISAVAAFAGGILSIKPVIAVVDGNGEIVTLGKARGLKQGHGMLTEEIEKAGGIDFSMPLLLGYSGTSDELLQSYLQDAPTIFSRSADEYKVSEIGTVIGTHVGPGGIAAAFFRKK